MVRKLKSEKYKGYVVTFSKIKDVDGNYAVQSFVNGHWVGTQTNKAAAFSLAKAAIKGNN
jgi:hypothetical protein